jgi:glycosyltransferase involved in cell wall biosynthesis
MAAPAVAGTFSAMRALIVDPALHSMGGHHYSAVLALGTELSRLGVEHACLASSFADEDVIQGLGAVPCFARSVYGRTEWTGREFAADVAETRRQLSWGWRRQERAPDLLILPCCDQVLALALARHLRTRRFAPVPHIMLWLLYAPHYKKPIDDPAVAELQDEYREAFVALRAVVGDDKRITAYCETAAMARAYREVVGLEIEVAPGPSLALAGAAAGGRRCGQPWTVVCIGFANEPKGYRLLPRAVGYVLQARPDVRFLIHGVVKGSDTEADVAVFDDLANMGERVAVSSEVLTREAYLSCLGQADLVLLPYDREVYKTRGSGVFNEARNMGIPVVATGGCDFARPAFEEGWGVEIVDRGGDGVGQAVLDALDRIPELTACARVAAASAAADHVGPRLEAAIDSIRADGRSSVKRLVHRLLRRA